MILHNTIRWINEVEPHLRTLTNAFTVLWTCIILGICILIWRMHTRQYGFMLSRVIRLTLLSLFMALVTWCFVAASFLPEIMSSLELPEDFILPWPSIGLAASFLTFLIFGYLVIWKKSSTIWFKIIDSFPLMMLPLLASALGGLCTWFIWLATWPSLLEELMLFFLIFIGYAFFNSVVVHSTAESQPAVQEKDRPIPPN